MPDVHSFRSSLCRQIFVGCTFWFLWRPVPLHVSFEEKREAQFLEML